MDAFRKAQELDPRADRRKASGFLLLVGPEPTVIDVGEDRERAVDRAVELLNEQDTIIFLAKVMASIGDYLITKDQLVMTRKY